MILMYWFYFFHQINENYLLFSHCKPTYEHGQLHIKVSLYTTHVPLFLHGLGMQGLTGAIRKEVNVFINIHMMKAVKV